MVDDLALLALLTNREKALVVWGVLLIAVLGRWTLRDADLRRSVREALRALLVKEVLLLFAATALYVTAVVIAAERLGVWHTGSVKEAVYWFFGTGVILTATAVTAKERGAFFKDVTRRAVRLTILVEFLVNFYVFPLGAELVLVPVVSVFLVLSAFSESDARYAEVWRATDRTLVVIGLALLGIATIRALRDLDGLVTTSNAEALLVPPALTLALMPFLFLIALYAAYEQRQLRKRLGFPV